MAKKNKISTQKKPLLRGQILELRGKNYPYRKIAQELGCSISTVSYHLSNTTKKVSLALRKYNRSKNALSTKIKAFLYREHRKKFNSITIKFTEEEFIKKFGSNPNCYLTGIEIDLDNKESYNLDHVVAISKGGNCSLDNCGVLTPEANQLKGSLSLKEFKKYIVIIYKHLDLGK